jgi:hypothetical protein
VRLFVAVIFVEFDRESSPSSKYCVAFSSPSVFGCHGTAT